MDHSVLYNFRKLFETPSHHCLFSYPEELKIIYPLQFDLNYLQNKTSRLYHIRRTYRKCKM